MRATAVIAHMAGTAEIAAAAEDAAEADVTAEEAAGATAGMAGATAVMAAEEEDTSGIPDADQRGFTRMRQGPGHAGPLFYAGTYTTEARRHGVKQATSLKYSGARLTTARPQA